ncbi:MAG: hypothetical protein JXB62_09885, partial [Pirellulales bacterium]|nr:hypothetical protein [Pirellulales bacterium]
MRNVVNGVLPETRVAWAVAKAACMLVALWTALPAEAGVVAYWRHEEGPVGAQPQHCNADPASGPWPILDSSGNDYHMATWSADSAPTWVSDIPVGIVPATGEVNTLAFDFTPNDDNFTYGYTGGGIEDMAFSAWTVEASFNVDHVDKYHGLVGKDGQPTASLLAPLQLKVRDDTDRAQIEILDGSGAERQVSSIAPIVPGSWYHVAAVNDGTTLELFLDSLDGNGYVSQGTVELTGGAMVESVGGWTVGRGFWNNGVTDWSDGRIDEVRISDTALTPSEFLFTAQRTLTWSGPEGGLWNSVNWTGGDPGDVPGPADHAIVQTTTVSVAEDAAAYVLGVESGGVAVATGRTLSVGSGVSFAAGTTLSLGAGATLSVSGSGTIQEVTTDGNAAIGVGGTVTIGRLDDGSVPGVLTKSGPGTLKLDNGSGDGVIAGNTAFEIRAGTLQAAGEAPLGEATSVTLAGGELRVTGPGTGAETVAYWRFEEGPVDTAPTVYQADWFVDSSGNGNHMWTWADYTSPTYRTDVPFGPVPQTGATNNLALEFNAAQDNYTQGKPITSTRFNELTVEASVKLDALDRWQVIVGKDGKPTDAAEPPLFLKFADDTDTLQAMMIDGSGTPRYIASDTPAEVGQWYQLAMTNDGTTMRFFIKGPGDANYVEQGTGVAVDGGALIASDGLWTVGRGVWDGGNTDWFDGMIDEVRISDRALAPSEFLGAGVGAGGDLQMAQTDLTVTADSTLNAIGALPVPFRSLTMQSGILTTMGAGGIVFDQGTTIAPGATSVGFNPQVSTDLGVITADGVTPVVISKVGSGDVVLDNFNTGLGAATFSAQEGRLIGRKLEWALPGSDPFEDATLRIDGGELVLDGGPTDLAVTFDNPVEGEANGILTAGPVNAGDPQTLTVNLGSASHGVTVNNGTLTLRSKGNYTLNVAGPISGPGTVRVSEGRVVLSSTDSAIESLHVSGGQLGTAGADLTIVGSLTLGDNVYAVEAGDTFQVRGDDLLASTALTLDGGRVAVVGPGGPSGTAAYWRFEEGPVDTQATVYQSDWYLDSSGNGNHMWTWADTTVPTYRADVPFNPVPQLQVPNDLSVQFVPNQDLYTNGKPINSQVFEQLTVEASVKLESLTAWQVFVGKDGKPVATEASPPLFLKFADSTDLFEAMMIDGGGTPRVIQSDFNPVVGEWYHLAMVNDGAMMRFFIKGPGDEDYVEQGEGVAVNGGAFIQSDASWTVGRGTWNGGITDWSTATIDEVRISDRALSLSELLSNEVNTAGLQLATSDFLVTADSTLHLDSHQATLGSIVLDPGVTLQVTGAGSTDVAMLAGGEGATLQGNTLVRGTLSPGGAGNVATTMVNGIMEVGDLGTYLCEISSTGHDRVDVINEMDLWLAGTLQVKAIEKIPPAEAPPASPWGPSSRSMVIMSTEGEGAVGWYFENEPAVGDHLGHGVFLEGVTVSYDDFSIEPGKMAVVVDADLFQAAPGDTDGSRFVNGIDIQNILSANRF